MSNERLCKSCHGRIARLMAAVVLAYANNDPDGADQLLAGAAPGDMRYIIHWLAQARTQASDFSADEWRRLALNLAAQERTR